MFCLRLFEGLAQRSHVSDYLNVSLVRLRHRRRESRATLLDSWGVPLAPPPLGPVEPQSLAASSPSCMELAAGQEPDFGTVLTSPMEELHIMRYAIM